LVGGYLEFVLATAKAGRAAGVFPLETTREVDLGEYAGRFDSERIVGNLHRAYRDLDGSGDELEVRAALLDMIAFNDGKPLSCYA
jgi:cyclase